MIGHHTRLMSESPRLTPDGRVVEWIDAQAIETLFLCSIRVTELRAGVALLPAGKRRAALLERLETRVLPLFAGRVLSCDQGCTPACAELAANARAAGLTLLRIAKRHTKNRLRHDALARRAHPALAGLPCLA